MRIHKTMSREANTVGLQFHRLHLYECILTRENAGGKNAPSPSENICKPL